MSFQLLSESKPTARKEHRCDWCGEQILSGETYFRYSGIDEGEMQSSAMHLECAKAMEQDLAEFDGCACDWGFRPHEQDRGKTSYETDERRRRKALEDTR